jgi:hypothetical protein
MVCGLRVTRGILSVQQVVNELDILIPGNKQWEIEPAGEGIFKVILPSKADMARLRKIKDLELEVLLWLCTSRNGPTVVK